MRTASDPVISLRGWLQVACGALLLGLFGCGAPSAAVDAAVVELPDAAVPVPFDAAPLPVDAAWDLARTPPPAPVLSAPFGFPTHCAGPSQVAAGDFDGDGLDDVITGGSGDLAGDRPSNLSVLLNRGGAFERGAGYTAGLYVESIVVGDLNRDGKLDLVAVSGEHAQPDHLHALYVFLGKGDGTFTPGATYPIYSLGVEALHAKDLNNDGVLDLVCGCADTFRTWLGKGDGTFGSPNLYVADAAPALGDVNGDGKLDAVSTVKATTAVFLGKGDGTFAPAITSPLPTGISGARTIGLGDLNGDGLLDAVLLADTLVIVMRGDGKGNLVESARALGVPKGWYPLGVADANGDGSLDVMVGTDGSSVDGGYLSFFLNYGDGTLAPVVVESLAGGGALSVAIRDFDRDGTLDFAVGGASVGGGGRLLLLYGANRAAVEAGSLWEVKQAFQQIRCADFDGDGRTDVLAIDQVHQSGAVILSDVNRVFKAQIPAVGAVIGKAFLLADWNEDGRADLALSVDNGTAIQILIGKGDGTFTSAKLPVAASPVAAVDVNGDKHLDLIAGSDQTVTVLLGAGDGTFATPRTSQLFGVRGATDFDGDGRIDLYGWDVTNNVTRLAYGDGTGAFGSIRPLVTMYGLGSFEDVNHDQKADFVLGVGGYPPGSPFGGFLVEMGKGDGSFGPVREYLGGDEPLKIAFTDFNRDGNMDFAGAATGGSVSFMLGRGDGTFKAQGDYPQLLITSWADVCAGDFDGDGKGDVIATQVYNGTTFQAFYGH